MINTIRSEYEIQKAKKYGSSIKNSSMVILFRVKILDGINNKINNGGGGAITN